MTALRAAESRFQSTWTDEKVEVVRAMWAAGETAKAIAEALNVQFGAGLTRNAVIGKIQRMALPARSNQKLRPKQRRRVGRKPKAATWRPAGVGGLRPRLEFIDPVGEDLKIPAEQRRQFFELERCHCRWPVGEPGKPDFFFCGGVALEDNPYCAEHCARAYRNE